MYNFRQFNDYIGTAGMPAAEELRDAASQGYQAVVNLATYDADSSLADENSLVESLGMSYHAIPVDWNRPQVSDYEEFCSCMRTLEGRKVLVHCAANYRASAFVALYALAEHGLSEEDADAFMKSVWETSEYPAWQSIIDEIKRLIRG